MKFAFELPVWVGAVALVLLAVDIAVRIRTAYWQGRHAEAEIERVTDDVLEKLREMAKP